MDLTGYLVDANEGLFLLGDHYPEDYDYKYRIKISNQNIIYSILSCVPALGGGKSSLFYKARVVGFSEAKGKVCAVELYVEKINGPGLMEIDIRNEVVSEYVKKYGNYEYCRLRDPLGDWLNDFS